MANGGWDVGHSSTDHVSASCAATVGGSRRGLRNLQAIGLGLGRAFSFGRHLLLYVTWSFQHRFFAALKRLIAAIVLCNFLLRLACVLSAHADHLEGIKSAFSCRCGHLGRARPKNGGHET